MEISQGTRYPLVSHGFYGSPKSRRMVARNASLGANRAASDQPCYCIVLPTALRTLLLRMLPRVITTMLRSRC